MTSEYSVSINWFNEFKEHPDRWINHGRDVLRASCKHYDADEDNLNIEDDDQKTNNIDYQGYCNECKCFEDSCEPMMNYGYPLHHLPDEEQILEVAKNTSLTIMENQDSGEYFLVLCGGGMDLSQSIAHAYMICGYIPDAMAFQVSEQYGLNISGETYFKVMEFVKNSLSNSIDSYKNRIERINEAINKAKTLEVKA